MEDYKQKYEIAIKQAKEELRACGDLDCDAARQIFRFFPELKESEDEKIRKECIAAIKTAYVDGENRQKWIAWLEKQGEQSIYDVPSRNMILAVWELGNEWKELTNGSISKEYGTQLEYIQKYWNESQYYLRDKQGEQKPVWSEEDEKMWSTISDLLWEGYKLSDKKVSWNKIRCWLFPKIKSIKERMKGE